MNLLDESVDEALLLGTSVGNQSNFIVMLVLRLHLPFRDSYARKQIRVLAFYLSYFLE